MADTAAPAKGLGATLAKKVGPFPLGVWLAGGIGLLWYYEKKSGSGSGAASAAGSASTQSTSGYGTDPAGNIGYIDPQTGYVYGSAEDISALQNEGLIASANPATGSDSGTGSTADTSGGTSATSSNGTPSSTTTTTNPSGTATSTPPAATGGPVSTAGAAPKNWQYPAPKGLSSSSVSDSGFRLSWDAVTGPQGQKPTGYTVAVWKGGTKISQHTVTVTNSIEYGAGGKGLSPSTSYVAQVWANGGPVAPPGAKITVTTKPKGSK